MNERISVFMSPNERGSNRAKALALAINDDLRFELPEFRETGIDLQFIHGENKFNVELKESADYIQSVLGKEGHLYQQILTMRETGMPSMVCVLGTDDDIQAAVKDALVTRYRGQELHSQIASYINRLYDFEANCYAVGVQVVRWKAAPWKRLLSLAHKTLLGGDLLGYRPRPAENERRISALAMLLGNGIGPAKAKAILEKFDIVLESKGGCALTECPGIGSKLADRICKKIKVV